MKTSPVFRLSLLAAALACAQAAHAEGEEAPQHSQELQNITVKGDTSTRRVSVKKMDETTSTFQQ